MRRFAKRIGTLFSVAVLSGACLHAQTITISPGYMNVPLGGTVQYTAAVTGLSPATVTWGVTAGGGTITQTGLYTAPSTLPANGVLISATSTVNKSVAAYNYVNPEGPGPVLTAMSPSSVPVGTDTVTITASPSAPFVKGATAVCNGAAMAAKFVSATSVTVTSYVGANPPAFTCYINNPGTWQSNSLSVPVGGTQAPAPVVSPATVSVALGATQQFSASNVSSWAASAGTITSSGFYTAPATTTSNGKATVTATGPGGSGSATVTLTATAPAPIVAPATVTLLPGATQQFSASNVTSWSATVGTITAAGLYTAPSTTTVPGTATVTATGPGGAGSATVTLSVPTPAPVVAPATVTLLPGATQQFSASNVTSWSAVSGAITSAGLYTAPAVPPASGADTVTATGPGGKGTALVTLPYPTPSILSLNPASLPLGSFTATIAGAGFMAASTATLGGTPLIVTAWTAGSLAVSGFAATSGMVNLVVSNGSVASAPLAVQVGNPNALVSAAAARRFLEQAAFGPSPADAANVQALGFQGWLNQQFAMPQISNYNAQAGSSQGGLPQQFLVNAAMNPDQLRQKVAFALSQIFVTSINTIIWNDSMVPYEQMLMADAFTNYSRILSDVTLSPTMGQYLDMANNAMGNPATGTIANQNYAREVMQLFTIGTTMLNQDGSQQLDGNNMPIPTYLQPTIAETSRVFTGWTYLPSSGPLEWNDYINPAGPMQPWPSEHDMGSKQLVNGFADPAGLTPQQDLTNALNNIFNHPNVGPFVGKLLIQHLVKSNPSPAYISRVAAAFNNNGNGVRGDMQAVVTAILLDPEARANDNGGSDQPTDGHLQEPALFIAGMFRAFGGTMSIQNYFGWDLVNMSQDIYNAPSVFNYYSPTFVPPGSALLGPEFQIYTPDSSVYRANMVASLFFSWSSSVLNYGPGTNLDVTPYVALASNPATLVAALDLTLTHGTMPAQMKQAIVTAVTNDTNGNLSRVGTGAWLILTSGYYNVWH